MSPPGSSRARHYAFADLALALRERAALTQEELAMLLGVSRRAVWKWEAGEAYPSAESLKRLILVYVDRQVLEPRREVEEAEALWEAARQGPSRLKLHFDPAWIADASGRAPARFGADRRAADATRHVFWGDAPGVRRLYGRAEEQETVTRWILAENVNLVAVLGIGGIGKTAFAVTVARAIAPQFDRVYWRSMRNAPPFEEWLERAIRFVSNEQHNALPHSLGARLDLMMALMKELRCLFVLDNFETVLEPGATDARYRAGYEGYGLFLRMAGETGHDGCLLLTSREKPHDLSVMEGEAGLVRSLHLSGLTPEEGLALLRDKGLSGDARAWELLVTRYGGNPLVLRMVGETIQELMRGDIASFLVYAHETYGVVFGGIRRLLKEQIDRLSPLERSLLYWLAIEREPIDITGLAADMGTTVRRRATLEALDGLRRRSLLEPGEQQATFTLQPVVLEYVTDRLVETVAREIIANELDVIKSHALVEATAKDYVRRSQEQLIAQPLVEDLRTRLGVPGSAERLTQLLDIWRGQRPEEQGYGPGNVVNLLRLSQGHLRGLDLSHLSIQHAYLQDVEAQDARLAGVHLGKSVLAGAFDYGVCVALSADGSILAVGTASGEIRLCRVADRTLLMVAQAHTAGIYGVALSPDGRRLVGGGLDGVVRMWDTTTEECLANFEGHSALVHDVAVSADGRIIASGSLDGTVRVWDAFTGACLDVLTGHAGVVWGVALSADGCLLASGGSDGAVRLWETSRAEGAHGRLITTLPGHAGGVWDVALSSDGRLSASGGLDGTIRLWDVASGVCRRVLQAHDGLILGVSLSADGRIVASGGFDGTIRLWETNRGTCLATLSGHTGLMRGIAMSADGRLIASASFDGTVKLWEWGGHKSASGECRLLTTLRGYTKMAWAIALSEDRRVMASGGMDGTIRLWEAEAGQLLTTLAGHTGMVLGLALSADGRLMASGGFDGMVKLWEVGSGRLRATLQGHTAMAWSVAVSSDGRIVASGSLDGTVRLWETGSGACLAVLREHHGIVWSVALSADGQLVTSGNFDGTIDLWEAEGGRRVATLRGHTGPVWSVASSADGRLIAGSGEDGTVRLWETGRGNLLATLEGHSGAVFRVAMSADGRLIASGGMDGTIRLWRIDDGMLLLSIQARSGAVWGMELSADGQLLVSGASDGAVDLWDMSTGTRLRTLRLDRPYERIDITGLTGITKAERLTLLELGAIEMAPSAVSLSP